MALDRVTKFREGKKKIYVLLLSLYSNNETSGSVHYIGLYLQNVWKSELKMLHIPLNARHPLLRLTLAWANRRSRASARQPDPD